MEYDVLLRAVISLMDSYDYYKRSRYSRNGRFRDGIYLMKSLSWKEEMRREGLVAKENITPIMINLA